jgi:hypothetical protein
MGVIYRHEFTSNIESIEWKIDIHLSGHGGAVTDFQCSTPGFTLSYKGEVEERNQPIKGSECVVHFLVENSSDLTFIQNIAAADEKEYSILVYKDSNLYWFGHIITDNIEWEDAAYPFQVDLTAIDYLSRLKDIDYDNSGTLYTGRETIVAHLIKILLKTGLGDFFTVAVDEFLSVGMDWWDTGHAARAQATDPAALTTIAHEALYIKGDEDEDIANNAYDVLEAILRQFSFRIWVGNGVFNVVQIGEYEDTTFFTRTYDNAGTALANYNSDYRETVDQTNISRIATGENTFYPALRQCLVTYDHKTSGSLINGYNFDPAVSIGTLTVGANNTLKFTGAVKFRYSGDRFAALAVFYINIQVGSYYLSGSLGFTSPYQATSQPSPPTWSLNSSSLVRFTWLVHGAVPGGGQFRGTFYVPLTFETPPIPASGAGTFRFRFIKYINADGTTATAPAGSTSTVWVQNFQLRLLDADAEENKETFSALNTTDGSTPINAPNIFEFKDNLFGDGPAKTTNGRLQYLPAAEDTTAWGEGTDTRDTNINKLLLQEYIAGQRSNTEIMQATIDGDIDFRSRLTYDSKAWMCGGVTLQADMDSWSGEWFEVDRDTNNVVTVSENVNDPTGFNPAIGDNREILGLVADMAFVDNNIRSITLTDQIVSSGNQTEIPITQVGETGLDVGDEIIVINRFTWEYDTVTVAAKVGATDNLITIDTYNFPEDVPVGSYISMDGAYSKKMLLEGKGNANVQVKTADYTTTPQDKHIQIDASSVKVTITLHSASGQNDEIYISTLDVTNGAVIDPNGAETINNEANFTFVLAYESVRLKSDGTNWIVQ